MQQHAQQGSAEGFDVAAAAVAVSNDNAAADAVQQQVAELKDPSVENNGPPLSRHGRPLTDTKRAQQNRVAQRAFRQRKEAYIKDLEEKSKEVDSLRETIDSLKQDNMELRDYLLAVQAKLIDQPDVPAPSALYGNRSKKE